jgi:SSS family solute:Na+ symporter
MYPHTLTGVFASASAKTLRKNAVLLPAYTLLLGLLALLGYMGLAAHLDLKSNTDIVPVLFQTFFPSWFAGFAFAAVAIGALVPAAVMSIGAANLFTRNFWKAYVNPNVTPAGEAQVAKLTSLFVKVGALLFILFLPTQFALDLQLLGGLWILQTFPAVVFGLYTNWFKAPALLAGWAIGFIGGTLVFYSDRIVTPTGTKLQPLHSFMLGDTKVAIYVGVLALAVNILVALAVNVVVPAKALQPAE